MIDEKRSSDGDRLRPIQRGNLGERTLYKLKQNESESRKIQSEMLK